MTLIKSSNPHLTGGEKQTHKNKQTNNSSKQTNEKYTRDTQEKATLVQWNWFLGSIAEEYPEQRGIL